MSISAALHNESATERNVSSSFIQIPFYLFISSSNIFSRLARMTYIIPSLLPQLCYFLFFRSPFPYSINIVLFCSSHTPTGRYPAYDGYPLYIINWQIGQVLYFILLLCHELCDLVLFPTIRKSQFVA